MDRDFLSSQKLVQTPSDYITRKNERINTCLPAMRIKKLGTNCGPQAAAVSNPCGFPTVCFLYYNQSLTKDAQKLEKRVKTPSRHCMKKESK